MAYENIRQGLAEEIAGYEARIAGAKQYNDETTVARYRSRIASVQTSLKQLDKQEAEDMKAALRANVVHEPKFA